MSAPTFDNLEDRRNFYIDKNFEAKEKKRELFSGTTCYRFIDVVAVYHNYFLIHHCSHSEYIDRLSKSKNCKSYYCLISYDAKRLSLLFYKEKEAALYFEGRINKNKWEVIKKYVNEHE